MLKLDNYVNNYIAIEKNKKNSMQVLGYCFIQQKREKPRINGKIGNNYYMQLVIPRLMVGTFTIKIKFAFIFFRVQR